ncbi:MAG: hypothetical protein ABSG21_04285 [Spirochaetia bacterium]
MARLKLLRVVVIAILVLLAFQFELGMALNLSPALPDVPRLGVSISAVWTALHTVGGVATTHALLGSFLVIVTLAALILSVSSRSTSIMVIGILCFITTSFAAMTGILFTLSGFKDDGLSHGMATNFLLSFALHFVQVCILSGKVRRQT